MAVEVSYNGFTFDFPEGTSDNEIYQFLEANAASMMEEYKEPHQEEPTPEDKLLPKPFYEMSQGEGTNPSYAFTNPNVDLSGSTVETQDGVNYYVEDSRGRTDGSQQDTANYEQRYKEDGKIDHSNPYWSQFGNAKEVIAQMELDKENGTNHPASYVNVGNDTINRGETEGVQSQEVDNEAAKEVAVNQISNIFKELVKDPEWANKSDEEVWEAAKLKYAEDAGETTFMALTLPVSLGRTLLTTAAKGAALLGSEELVGEASRYLAGEELDVTKSAKEVGKGAATGAALGPAGKVLGDVGAKAFDLATNNKAITALKELDTLGKKAKDAAKTAEDTNFPERLVDDIIVDAKKGATVGDVTDASNLSKAHIDANEEGARVGVTRLSDAVNNPEIQKLIKEAGSRGEKVAKAVTGEKGNKAREKVAENLGLRDTNLKTQRKEAAVQLQHDVSNSMEELVSKHKNLPIVNGFKEQLDELVKVSNARNGKKFDKLFKAAQKEAKLVSGVDAKLYKEMKENLAKVKSYHNINKTSSVADENSIVPHILSGLGAASQIVPSQGEDWTSSTTKAALTAAAILGGRKAINAGMNKGVKTQQKRVDKALKGELGELKRRHKIAQALGKGGEKLPDGMLLRAYMMLEDN